MKILVGTDVLIDLALDRQPFSTPAADLLDALERMPGQACVAWHTLSNFYYLVSPKLGPASAQEFLADVSRFVQVAPTTTESLRLALSLDVRDFEDALQIAAAYAFQAGLIATRNLKDYKRSPIPAVLPSTALESILGRT